MATLTAFLLFLCPLHQSAFPRIMPFEMALSNKDQAIQNGAMQ
ncbi:hypothetical protein L195_g063989, partial [Trifolium pratense]